MAVTSVVQTRSSAMQFRGAFRNVIEIEAIYDPPSVNSNSFQSEDITVPGAELGDFALITFEDDLQDLNLSVNVKSEGVVTVHLFNPTAGAVNLGSGQIHIMLLRPYHQHG